MNTNYSLLVSTFLFLILTAVTIILLYQRKSSHLFQLKPVVLNPPKHFINLNVSRSSQENEQEIAGRSAYTEEYFRDHYDVNLLLKQNIGFSCVPRVHGMTSMVYGEYSCPRNTSSLGCSVHEEILKQCMQDSQLKHILIMGDSRVRHISHKYTLLSNVGVGDCHCANGAASSIKYQRVHCNYHCLNQNHRFDFWWVPQLNQSIVNLFTSMATGNTTVYGVTSIPGVIIATFGLWNAGFPMDKFEELLTHFFMALSLFSGTRVYYLEQTPVRTNAATSLTVLNNVSEKVAQTFPKIHYIKGYADVALLKGNLGGDGKHYDTVANNCFFLHTIYSVCSKR